MLLKISKEYWDMGAYVHGYAIKVKWNVSHYFWGPKLFTKHKIKTRPQNKQSNETLK